MDKNVKFSTHFVNICNDIFMKFPLQLDVIHLSKDPIPVTGNYVNSDAAGLPTRLSVEYDALERLVLFISLLFFFHMFVIIMNQIF